MFVLSLYFLVKTSIYFIYNTTKRANEQMTRAKLNWGCRARESLKTVYLISSFNVSALSADVFGFMN